MGKRARRLALALEEAGADGADCQDLPVSPETWDLTCRRVLPPPSPPTHLCSFTEPLLVKLVHAGAPGWGKLTQTQQLQSQDTEVSREGRKPMTSRGDTTQQFWSFRPEKGKKKKNPPNVSSTSSSHFSLPFFPPLPLPPPFLPLLPLISHKKIQVEDIKQTLLLIFVTVLI